MKRIIAVLCLCAFVPAGAFDYNILTRQELEDFYKYFDDCKEIVENRQFSTDEYQWCNKFFNEIRACQEIHPKNPLKDYTAQETSSRNLKIIECTSIFIEW